MSFILDALRKSEHQRQRQVGPGLAIVPESPTRPAPAIWVLVLGGLLFLNILVLGALLLTDDRSEQVAAAPPVADAGASPGSASKERRRDEIPPPAVAPPGTTRGEVRPLTTEVAAPVAAPVATPEPAPAPAAQPAAPAPAALAPAQLATADARLPRFSDLVIRGELNVPHMHLDIHVYSANTAERFVFINMRRYNEGEATQEGPRVERIVSDGVVMDHQGQRFFLSRD
jgi:general secretion pathway protein B